MQEKKSGFARVVSLGVSVLFFITGIPVKLPASQAPVPTPVFLSPLEAALALSPAHGFIENKNEVESAEGKRAVFIIKDAHGIGPAQTSIFAILQELLDRTQMRLVGLEGASDKLDAGVYRAFPDKKILFNTMQTYLQNGELSGAAVSSVFAPERALYYGVEERGLYRGAIHSYIQASMKSKEALDVLKTAEKMFSDQVKRSSPGFQKTLQLLHQQKNAHGGEALRELLMLPVSGRLHPAEDFHAVTALKSMLAGEDMLRSMLTRDFNQIGFETSDELRQTLIEKSTAFENGKLTAHEYAAWLAAAAENGRFHLPAYVKTAAEKHQLFAAISPRTVEKQLSLYLDLVLRKAAATNEDERAYLCYLELRDLRALYRLELTPEQWLVISNAPRRVKKNGGDEAAQIEKLYSFLMAAQSPWRLFYESADMREKYMSSNLMRIMRELGEESAVLVAGGFHAESLAEIFRGRNFVPVIISPAISKLPPQDPYKKLMLEGPPWKLLAESKGSLDLYGSLLLSVMERMKQQISPEVFGFYYQEWNENLLQMKRPAEKYTGLISEQVVSRLPKDLLSDLESRWMERVKAWTRGHPLHNHNAGKTEKELWLKHAAVHWFAVSSFVPEIAPDFREPGAEQRHELRSLDALGELFAEGREDFSESLIAELFRLHDDLQRMRDILPGWEDARYIVLDVILRKLDPKNPIFDVMPEELEALELHPFNQNHFENHRYFNGLRRQVPLLFSQIALLKSAGFKYPAIEDFLRAVRSELRLELSSQLELLAGGALPEIESFSGEERDAWALRAAAEARRPKLVGKSWEWNERQGLARQAEFKRGNPNYEKSRKKFAAVQLRSFLRDAYRRLSDEKSKMKFDFSLYVPSSPEGRELLLQYLDIISKLKKRFPAQVRAEVKVLAAPHEMQSADWTGFARRLEKPGISEILWLDKEGIGRLRLFLSTNKKALVYGAKGIEIDDLSARFVVSNLKTDDLLPLSFLVTNYLAGERIEKIDDILFRNLSLWFPGVFSVKGNRLYISDLALELYLEFERTELVGRMA